MRSPALSILLLVAACKSAGTPSTPPPPPEPAVAAACAPSGSACFTRAEELSDADPAGAEEALRHCLSCLDVPPASYQLLATLLADRDAREEARQTLQLGVRRFPGSVLLRRALGRLSLQLGRHREGIAALSEARRLRPNDAELGAELQAALAEHGTEEDRLEAELQPLLLEATGRYELDDSDGALEVLELALKKSEPVPALRALVHHRIAIVHLAQGRLPEAKRHLEAAMESQLGDSEARAELLVSYAEALLSEGDFREAEKRAAEAIELDPKNPLAHANLAIARSLSGDLEGAISSFGKAFDSGLARRLTLSDFLSLGKSIEALEHHPRFVALVKRAYPSAAYPGK